MQSALWQMYETVLTQGWRWEQRITSTPPRQLEPLATHELICRQLLHAEEAKRIQAAARGFLSRKSPSVNGRSRVQERECTRGGSGARTSESEHVDGLVDYNQFEGTHVSADVAASVIQEMWYKRREHLHNRFAESDAQKRELAVTRVQRFYRKRKEEIALKHGRRTQAATVISRVYRKKVMLRSRAATKIQRFFHRCQLRSRRLDATTKLQRIWRGRRARLELKAAECATVKVQAQVRKMLAQQLARKLKEKRDELRGRPLCDECEQEICTVVCWSEDPGNSCRAKYCSFCSACIHKLLPTHTLCAVEWDRPHVNAAHQLQQWWRQMKQAQAAEIEKANVAAAKIQNCFRSRSSCKRFRMWREAAILIQSLVRRYVREQDYGYRRGCAIRIQAVSRRHLVAREVENLRDAADVIQRQFRRYKSKQKFKQETKAALVVQSMIRGRLVRTKLSKMENCAISIQRSVRGHLARSEARQKHLRKMEIRRKMNAKSKIIAVFRRHQEHTRVRVSSAVRIQAWFRCVNEWTHQVESIAKATRLQTLFRSRQRRVEYFNRREACVLIQRQLRRYVAQNEYEQIRAAVVRVQAAWRRVKGEYSKMLLRTARTAVARDITDCVWSRHVDPWSQQEYFFNRATTETRWDCPLVLKEHEARLAAQAEARRASTGLEEAAESTPRPVGEGETVEDWLIHFDDSTGAKYYESKKSGDVCWERPSVLGPDPDTPLWTVHIHPVNNYPYYVNTATGETCWERPKELGPEYKEYWDSGEKKSYWMHVVTGEVLWKDPFAALVEKAWYAAQDENGNTYYYLYNPQTEKTEEIQWEKPEELFDEQEKLQNEMKKWEEYWSSDVGKSYYKHKITGKTTWKKPF